MNRIYSPKIWTVPLTWKMIIVDCVCVIRAWTTCMHRRRSTETLRSAVRLHTVTFVFFSSERWEHGGNVGQSSGRFCSCSSSVKFYYFICCFIKDSLFYSSVRVLFPRVWMRLTIAEWIKMLMQRRRILLMGFMCFPSRGPTSCWTIRARSNWVCGTGVFGRVALQQQT